MTWQENEGRPLPTANTRLNWARNNYRKYSLQGKVQKYLVLLMNLVALNDLMEEEGGEALLTSKQKSQWLEMYESYRPTRPVGRPLQLGEGGTTE